MYIKALRCYACGQEYPRTKLAYRCDCGGGLEILYDYDKLRKRISWVKLRKRPLNHWRYEEFYPHLLVRVSLAEGGTPLVESIQSSKLFFKLESCNPTGSFKDRGSTLEISHAKQFKHVSVVCASTGNMGASVSAYCARAGLDCEIFLPSHAVGSKIEQIKSYGSRVTTVTGDYTLAMTTAYLQFQKYGKFLVGDYAFRGEGEKSVGFEIIDQFLLSHNGIPDVILCPIGNGTLISGIWKGVNEMKKVGLVDSLPKLIGVQARGCNPVERAFATDAPIKPVKPRTIAGAVACGDPLDGISALQALEASHGTVISFTDKELLSYRKELAEKEGIDAEPSGVLSYAAWKQLKLQRQFCVSVITGHGLKDLEHR